MAEHPKEITNDVGHPKSFFVDRAVEEGFVLETCMYFPFVTAKNLTGFGAEHAAFLQAFPRLQMILVLACDKAIGENRVAVDRDGNPLRFDAEGLLAIVLQHEIDHLNGTLFIDRISKLKRELYKKRILKQLKRK